MGVDGRWRKIWEPLMASGCLCVEESFACPLCNQIGLSETDLYFHFAQIHGENDEFLVCPICVVRKNITRKQGERSKGFGAHLAGHHPPAHIKAELEAKKKAQQRVDPYARFSCFSLVVVRHPDGRFLLVKEIAKRGWWYPGGHVDPGETFQEAALRETWEEAGVRIRLDGVIRVEFTPDPSGGARQRIIFLASPTDPDAPPKSVPDYESLGAEWISLPDLEAQVRSGEKKLRDTDCWEYFRYIYHGGHVGPISMLAFEGEPVGLPNVEN
eukprot:TRINITY_DN4469_c0_g1_i2.p1 TRINITY_DN4469_c0_g1~~TRINITY_DN4469_c0_g1_i2.p1  ORF type:complete len:280 (+),score=58.03 TRINITY_DN4469_c0_g1_i2:33-842(+)